MSVPSTEKCSSLISSASLAMYSGTGRPSVPPERLLKAMVLMALYGIRAEVLLCEQLHYNMLFRWFLNMDMVEAPFDHCAFLDNRKRLLERDAAGKFFRQVVHLASRLRARRLSASSAIFLIGRSGWLGGTRSSMLTRRSIHDRSS